MQGSLVAVVSVLLVVLLVVPSQPAKVYLLSHYLFLLFAFGAFIIFVEGFSLVVRPPLVLVRTEFEFCIV